MRTKTLHDLSGKSNNQMVMQAESSITIDAPIERVWEVMLDVKNYPAWNPFVVRVETSGDVSVPSAAMRLFVEWNNGGRQSSDELIEIADSPSRGKDGIKRACWAYRFTGFLAATGAVKAIRYQWLEERGNGQTLYRTREEFTGWLCRFIPLAKVQDGFKRQAAALADHCNMNKNAAGAHSAAL